VTFLVRVVVNAIALAVATWLFDGISVSGTDSERFWTMLAVAFIFGFVNAIVTPIVMLLSLPFIILTLGLMIFVVNALMLMLTSWISEQIGLDFHVDGFWTAVWGSIVISIVSWLLGRVLVD